MPYIHPRLDPQIEPRFTDCDWYLIDIPPYNKGEKIVYKTEFSILSLINIIVQYIDMKSKCHKYLKFIKPYFFQK